MREGHKLSSYQQAFEALLRIEEQASRAGRAYHCGRMGADDFELAMIVLSLARSMHEALRTICVAMDPEAVVAAQEEEARMFFASKSN